MKAFYIDAPGQTAIREAPPPELEASAILLKTRVVGLCGTDLSSYRGKNPLVSYPRIPGHEIAAEIVEVAQDVPAHLRPGMQVTVHPTTACGKCASCRRGRTNACKFNQTMGVQRDGAMQDYFAAPWQKVYAADGLSLCELSFVEPLAVGFHAAERGRVAAADTVAIIGCGTVGLGALASAASRGATVIAIDLDDEKLSLARRVGARHTINSRLQSVHDHLLDYTQGLGPDVVIEAVGCAPTYQLAVEEVAHTGRVVYIGWTKEPVSYETKLFVHKELDILGSRNSLTEFPAVIEMLSKKQFPVTECISTTVPFGHAGDALRHWDESPNSFTKILVELDGRS